jgi:CubicO group peptidase (beta-lactamase class C family)
MRPLAALLDGAAFPEGTPVAVARVDRAGVIEEAVAGTWPDGVAVTVDDPFYGASLTKQVTGAAVAVLVREGRLDPDAPLSSIVGNLPQWAGRISIRQMLHHTSGLPGAGEISSAIVTRDWTNEVVFTALRALEDLRSEPGTKFDYSNAGYTLLAHIVGSVSGQHFADVLAEHLFRPLGIEGLGFSGPDLSGFRQHPLLGPKKPLTQGSGGLWCIARGFAAWLHAQNEDRLGIAPLVTAPGRLNDGSPVDYGWGIGLRSHRNRPLYIHGGGWPGAVSKAVRSPDHGVAVVGFAAGVPWEMIDAVVTAALDDATL